MEKRTYGLTEAADVADVPLDELRRAIQDGLLPAKLFHNTGEWHIDAEDLARYVKRTRHADPFGRTKKRKVLIIGEDLLYAGTVKLELTRDPRLDVRYASWGKDAVLMVNHYGADLFIVDLTPSKAVPDEVLAAVQMQRARGKKAAIAYFAFAEEALDVHPLVRSRLTSLAPEAFMSKTRGLRALTVACYAVLGLETNTRIFRLPG
ncbi:MAG TPA: hypothetical protein VG457_10505 [Planctomycetota bacterium]|jgi:hypothetical protein|nr:hypothetical protein [Planctomycetota bacterium]